MTMEGIKIIECPRDAMQGIESFIPTQVKAKYINQLLKVGFDTIDFGSFVSPAAVPQMKDTAEVLSMLNLSQSKSKLLAIIANVRGAEQALTFDEITYLGFPLSLSETFQKRNTNKSIEEAFAVVAEVQDLCVKKGKQFVVYLSMAFGNPYGDPFDIQYISDFVKKLDSFQIPVISLSDTIGVSTEENITFLFKNLCPAFPKIEFGAHLHSNPFTSYSKIKSAYLAGCRRFDTALNGFGGCPMAKDELVGNVATETLIKFLKDSEISPGINQEELELSMALVSQVFPK
ncbi:MAG: hydroxymethylglutaryl-CoA lyase [Cytophagaceae bacterium]